MKKTIQLLKALSASHPLLSGTLFLTAAGAVSRLIGFFYRIFLSRTFGGEGMGIVQLLSPVIAISYCLSAAGLQNAISKVTAEEATGKNGSRTGLFAPLRTGLGVSLLLSLACSGFVYCFAEEIGENLLHESRTVPLLRILALSFPFSAAHSCIHGWFYGMKKASGPSLAQLIEQFTRVGVVWYLVSGSKGTPSLSVTVCGILLGEMVNFFFSAIFLCFRHRRTTHALPPAKPPTSCGRLSKEGTANRQSLHGTAIPEDIGLKPVTLTQRLLSFAVPLTANRLILNLLGSMEAVAIPTLLRQCGYSSSQSLTLYGTLTGMALPFIFFPNALTNAVAVMLLPMISESNFVGDIRKVRSLTERILRLCTGMGMFFAILFVAFGPFLGELLFHNSTAGQYIRILGFICPLLYLDTAFSAILQGLGKVGTIFYTNLSCMLVRLTVLTLFIPRVGMKGYLWGILAGQLVLTSLCTGTLLKFFVKNPKCVADCVEQRHPGPVQ